MTGAFFRQAISKQQIQRRGTAFFDVFLLQYKASFMGAQYCYFNNLNIYS